jgi:hypothetical protein
LRVPTWRALVILRGEAELASPSATAMGTVISVDHTAAAMDMAADTGAITRGTIRLRYTVDTQCTVCRFMEADIGAGVMAAAIMEAIIITITGTVGDRALSVRAARPARNSARRALDYSR